MGNNNNRIIIGKDKDKDKKKAEGSLTDLVVETGTLEAPPADGQTPPGEELDEKLWANDHAAIKYMDDDMLADRRLYVRVVFVQQIMCNTILESLDSEPITLPKPIAFMIMDISVGGIGIICEYTIDVGSILSFNLTLDNIPYEIKTEVVYCFPNGGKYRIGLKLAKKDKAFFRHLKILVARISLNAKYGNKPAEPKIIKDS